MTNRYTHPPTYAGGRYTRRPTDVKRLPHVQDTHYHAAHRVVRGRYVLAALVVVVALLTLTYHGEVERERATPVLVGSEVATGGQVAPLPAGAGEKTLEVDARAYLAVDLDSGEVLAGKAVDVVVPIASITKLVTAIVALEQYDLARTLVVPERAIVYTSTSRYTTGETVRAYDLLFPLLTESSNEAAITLEDGFGRTDFVARLNHKARSIGMQHTTFVDTSGRGAGNVSTATDLTVLARYLLEHAPRVLDLTANRFAVHPKYGPPPATTFGNYNYYAHDLAFVGGKSGKTTAAQETLLAVFEEDYAGVSRQLVYIVIGAENVKHEMDRLRAHVVQGDIAPE